jgi:hypothetical protein
LKIFVIATVNPSPKRSKPYSPWSAQDPAKWLLPPSCFYIYSEHHAVRRFEALVERDPCAACRELPPLFHS